MLNTFWQHRVGSGHGILPPVDGADLYSDVNSDSPSITGTGTGTRPPNAPSGSRGPQRGSGSTGTGRKRRKFVRM